MAKSHTRFTSLPSWIPGEKAEKVVKVMLEVPESLYEHFKEQGDAWGRTTEHEMALRLSRCKSHVSTTPLYFTDDERAELSRALGHVCNEPAVVLAQIKNAVTLKVGEVKVEVPPNVQQRLKTRVFRGMTYETMLKSVVMKALRVYCGLDPA